MTILTETIPDRPATAPDAPASPTTMSRAGTESLRRGEIATDISPTLAKIIAFLFLAGILAVPLIQSSHELINERRIQALDLLKPPASATKQIASGNLRDGARTLKTWLTKDHLADYERELEDRNLFKQRLQPRVQQLITRHGRFGNSMVVAGRDGWLYYQLGISHLSGPGFLSSDFRRRQESAFFADGEDDVNADPRPAIIQFHNDCQRAGVHLVFVPIPVKEMIAPHHLAGLAPGDPIPLNPDYPQFVLDLRAAGVDVFDSFIPTNLPDKPRDLYLRTDTHWTPQWMEHVARQLADHVKQRVPLDATSFRTVVEEVEVEHVGDLVDTLKLPENQRLYPPKRVTIRRVLAADTRAPIQSDPSSDVLFIGDSFSNIYSAPEMHWGESAGLPFHLARLLNRPLDTLVKNGSAATELREELSKRPHPLRGKKVVVWQVAMHELSCSNWKVIPLPQE